MKVKLAISNSAPLIHLAQINALFLLKELYKEVTITEKVETEVVERGKEEGCADALLIEKGMQSWIKVVKAQRKIDFSSFGLHDAEAEVISHALDEKFDLVLLDDDAARELARTLGLRVQGSIGIIIEALRMKKISKKEARKFLDALVEVMYLSGEAYAAAREGIEKV